MRGPGHAPTNGTRGPARRLPGQGVVLEPRAHGRAGPHLDIGQVARRPGSASLMSRKVCFVFFINNEPALNSRNPDINGALPCIYHTQNMGQTPSITAQYVQYVYIFIKCMQAHII